MISTLSVVLWVVAASGTGSGKASAPSATLAETVRLVKGCHAGELASCVELIASPEVEEEERENFSSKAALLDERGARKLAEEGCRASRPASCHALGLLYQRAVGGKRLEAEGADALQRACDAGRTLACLDLVSWYLGGMEGPPRDTSKALALLEKACLAGEPSACFGLGGRYVDGENVKPDRTRGVKLIQQATQLFEAACNAGRLPACQDLAVAFQGGHHVPQSDARAAAYYRKAAQIIRQRCDLGDLSACYRLGGKYRDGEGVPEDFKAAHSLLMKA
jgi:hypothetical protein